MNKYEFITSLSQEQKLFEDFYQNLSFINDEVFYSIFS